MESNDVEISDDILDTFNNLENQSKTIILLAVDEHVRGILSLSDKVKQNSKRSIEELRKMGVET